MKSERIDAAAVKRSVDIQAFMQGHYGVSPTFVSGGGMRFPCVAHGGTNPTSLSYTKKNGVLHCFGECGFTGDVFKLVQQTDNVDFLTALKVVSEYATGDCNGYQAACKTSDPLITTLSRAYGECEKHEPISSKLVERAKLYSPNPYVSSGKFDQETVEYHEVGYCDFNEYFMGRAIIPIHDECGVLIGYSGRDMAESTKSANKYRIKKGFKKGNCLYNLHRAKEHLGPKNPLVIVEGFGQVWRLYEAGVKTAVALMGKDITPVQRDLILKYSPACVLALDFDEAGVKATREAIKQLDGLIDVRVATSRFGPNIDLGDMPKEAALECYQNSIPAYLWSYNNSEDVV